MSLFSRLFEPAERKASRGFSLHGMALRPAQWNLLGKPEKNAREGYHENVVAYMAISKIATAVSNIKWQAWQDDKKLESHPFLDLLHRPNPMMTGRDWWIARTSYLLISGNSYTERVTGTGSRPVELWPIRPDRMKVELSRVTGLPVRYIYRVSNNEVVWGADPRTGESDIRHRKLFNPLDDVYGMSPIQAGAYGIDQHTETMKWTQALLQNSARPSGALVVDSETTLSDEEFNRLKVEVENQYSGAENAGRPMLLEGGLKWEQMGLSPMDMEVLKTQESSARHIALAFAVPPLLLNIPGDNTYSNYREARLGFYEDTVLPYVMAEAADMNAWLSESFGGVTIWPDLASIEALAEKRQRMWEMADASDDITLNESRAMKNLPPLPEPLGSTLMSEIRSKPREQRDPESAEAVSAERRSLVYGTR